MTPHSRQKIFSGKRFFFEQPEPQSHQTLQEVDSRIQAIPDLDLHESCYYAQIITGMFENGSLEEVGNFPAIDHSKAGGGILVVEDCEPLLFYLDSALIALGFHQQHLAANLAEAEAVWALHKNQIQHVILNYELPDGIAFDFAARLLRDSPSVNIIVTTGYDLATVKEACGNSEPFQFLQKPFRLDELKQALGSRALDEATCR